VSRFVAEARERFGRLDVLVNTVGGFRRGKPVHEDDTGNWDFLFAVNDVRLGCSKPAVWQNETDSGIRHNVTFTRLSKDGAEWKDSISFGPEDLPLFMKVADRAHSWIYENAGGADK
jgi:hypothetical protein